MNIVSMAMQYLTPIIVNKIASSFGINSTLAQKAIAVILPTIFAGIVGKATAPGGGQVLSDILGKQDAGVLGKLGDIIGGQGQKALVEQGGNVLGDLLGGNALGALAGAAGKFTGIGEAPTKGLIGMLAPVVLGSLAGQQKSAGLDAAGLVSMLAGQKDNIAAAIPGDFAKMLGGSGLIDSIGPNMAKRAQVAHAAPAPKAPPGSGHASRSFNYMPWIIALLAAGAAYWFLFSGSSKQASIPVPPKIIVGNADIGSQLHNVVGGLPSLLGGLKDADSAKKNLPAVRLASDEVNRIGGLMGQLNGGDKSKLASYAGALLPVLMPVISKSLANSSVGPILKPVLDSLVGGLNKMAKG